MSVVLLAIAVLAGACDSGEADRLREQLSDVRAQLSHAQAAAQDAESAAQDSERDRRSIARELEGLRRQLGESETPGEGLVVSVPLVGQLRWKCNDDRDFSFMFSPDLATITVEQLINGEITRKTLDPGEEITSPFQPAEVHREWTVIYRHKPGTISAGISVGPGVEDGACFIRNSTLEQNRSPN